MSVTPDTVLVTPLPALVLGPSGDISEPALEVSGVQ